MVRVVSFMRLMVAALMIGASEAHKWGIKKEFWNTITDEHSPNEPMMFPVHYKNKLKGINYWYHSHLFPTPIHGGDESWPGKDVAAVWDDDKEAFWYVDLTKKTVAGQEASKTWARPMQLGWICHNCYHEDDEDKDPEQLEFINKKRLEQHERDVAILYGPGGKYEHILSMSEEEKEALRDAGNQEHYKKVAEEYDGKDILAHLPHRQNPEAHGLTAEDL